MKINIDKKVLRYFFILATISILFPPFYETEWSVIRFSFLLDPPRRSDGVSMSLLTVEIIASFIVAYIINFVISETPKKYLYGVPVFLLIVWTAGYYIAEYINHLDKQEFIKESFEKSKKFNSHKQAIECKSNKLTDNESLIWVDVDNVLHFVSCESDFPYLFGDNPIIKVNKYTSISDIEAAHKIYIKSIESKLQKGLQLNNEEKKFIKVIE